MKKLISLIAGFAFILLLATTVHASTLPVSPKKVNTKAKTSKADVDPLYPFFGFTATSEGGYNYDIKIEFLVYNGTTGEIISGGTCPTDVGIKITSGPYAGASFTFPAGNSTYDLGLLQFASDPGGSNYSITTNPTSINDTYPIAQTLYGGSLFP